MEALRKGKRKVYDEIGRSYSVEFLEKHDKDFLIMEDLFKEDHFLGVPHLVYRKWIVEKTMGRTPSIEEINGWKDLILKAKIFCFDNGKQKPHLNGLRIDHIVIDDL